jgi:hypothetical protein
MIDDREHDVDGRARRQAAAKIVEAIFSSDATELISRRGN